MPKPKAPTTEPGAHASYRTRTWVLFAARARKAVILRRGPRRHYHLIDWDLSNDTFTHGQWMKGYVRLWDLSPDGSLLLYWAHQYHKSLPLPQRAYTHRTPAGRENYDPMMSDRRRRSPSKREQRRKLPRYMREPAIDRPRARPRDNWGVWTALSRPPHFSALAIWPSVGHWTGGGTFLTNTSIILNEEKGGLTAQENVAMPRRFSVRDNRSDLYNGGWPRFAGRHGWQTDPAVTSIVSAVLRENGVTWVDWIVPQGNGSLLFACDGVIYRLPGWQNTPPCEYLSAAQELADLRNLSFRQVAPLAEAMRW
jgi:hypothetical protein